MSDWMTRTDKKIFAAMFPDRPLEPWGWGVNLGDSEETTMIVEIEPHEASQYYLATFAYFSMKKERAENWVTEYFENPESRDEASGDDPALAGGQVQKSPYSKLHYQTVERDAQPLLDKIDASGGEVLAVDIESYPNETYTAIIWKTVTLPDDMEPYVVLEDITPHALHDALNQYHDKGYEVMSLDTGPEGSHGEIYYTVVLKHRAI